MSLAWTATATRLAFDPVLAWCFPRGVRRAALRWADRHGPRCARAAGLPRHGGPVCGCGFVLPPGRGALWPLSARADAVRGRGEPRSLRGGPADPGARAQYHGRRRVAARLAERMLAEASCSACSRGPADRARAAPSTAAAGARLQPGRADRPRPGTRRRLDPRGRSLVRQHDTPPRRAVGGAAPPQRQGRLRGAPRPSIARRPVSSLTTSSPPAQRRGPAPPPCGIREPPKCAC